MSKNGEDARNAARHHRGSFRRRCASSSSATMSTSSASPSSSSSPTVACWEAAHPTNRAPASSTPTADFAVDSAAADLTVIPRSSPRIPGEPRLRSGLLPAPFSLSPAFHRRRQSPLPRRRAPGRASGLGRLWAGHFGHPPGLRPSLGRPPGRPLRVTPRPWARPGPVWRPACLAIIFPFWENKQS